MSQLKEIIEKEQVRNTSAECYTIHLFREGTFYRAYEWSAWLSVRYYTDLKVTHRFVKSGEDIVFIGFPLTSLERYTPQGAAVMPVDDKLIDITLSASDIPTNVSLASMHSDFANWKQSQPLTEASKKAKEEVERQERNAPPRLTNIMLSILAYPVERHTPMECMSFLSDIKRQISEIL